jgi:hypothetical protein
MSSRNPANQSRLLGSHLFPFHQCRRETLPTAGDQVVIASLSISPMSSRNGALEGREAAAFHFIHVVAKRTRKAAKAPNYKLSTLLVLSRNILRCRPQPPILYFFHLLCCRETVPICFVTFHLTNLVAKLAKALQHCFPPYVVAKLVFPSYPYCRETSSPIPFPPYPCRRGIPCEADCDLLLYYT